MKEQEEDLFFTSQFIDNIRLKISLLLACIVFHFPRYRNFEPLQVKEMLKHSFENLRAQKGLEREIDLKVVIPSRQFKDNCFGSPTSIATRRSYDITPAESPTNLEDLSCNSSVIASDCEENSVIISFECSSKNQSDEGIASVFPWRPRSPTDQMLRSPQQILRDNWHLRYLEESGLKKW